MTPETPEGYRQHFLDLAGNEPWRALVLMAEELAIQNASRLAAEEECAELKREGYYRSLMKRTAP
jgi:hypothetical protein